MEEKPDFDMNEEGFPIQVEDGCLQFVKVLDKGGDGSVCLYKSNPDTEVDPLLPELVAVKFNTSNEMKLKKQAMWMKS